MTFIKQTFFAAVIACSAFVTGASAAVIQISAEERAEEYSLSRKSVALSGYDPVAYFGNGPQEGKKSISYTHEGVVYRFASKENLEKFKASPASYEPQYGGWCAWAMYKDGGRTEPDPKNYKIVEGKLYVFYKGLFGDTLKLWNETSVKQAEVQLISTANTNWQGQFTNVASK
ncbi:MAG: YHS domain-containing (seleno)protein [Verrucomicrobiota bacterium]